MYLQHGNAPTTACDKTPLAVQPLRPLQEVLSNVRQVLTWALQSTSLLPGAAVTENSTKPYPEPHQITVDTLKFPNPRESSTRPLCRVYAINDWAGDGGGKLKQQEGGCGGMTGWSWEENDEFGDTAGFNLPFTIKKGCVERAIRSAGGPEGVKCKGQGLGDKRKRDGKGKRSRTRQLPPTRTYG
ncbi:MAG: hypothetical protein Q9226_002805 [Calogaya cf. arnoldii]